MEKSLCEHNEDSQCVENFSWILEPAAYKNNPLRFKPCERHIYRIVFNGHSAFSVPVTVQNGHKSYDYQEYAKYLYECKECRNNSSFPQCHLRHARTQTEEKLYESKQCRESFSDNSFQIHKRIPASQKPDVCKQHRKEFRNNAGVERQIIAHTGDSPCKCKKYTKDFPIPLHCLCIQVLILERSSMYVNSVVKDSLILLPLSAMERCIMKRDPMFVSTVRKRLLVQVP